MLQGQKDFLDTQNFSAETLERLIDLAIRMKKNKGRYSRSLAGKKLGMIFEKSSTRTRVSFEVGIQELGGSGLFLSSRDIQIGRGEPISDTARVLSRYLDGIMIRTYKQSDVEELSRAAAIPVINGLTDSLHPCQAMADFQTIREMKGKISGLKFCFIGDGNNMAHSLGLLATKLGVDFAIATPEGYRMDAGMVRAMEENARVSGSKMLVTTNPREAAEGADILYTDVWTSMGQESENEKRLRAFQGYGVNADIARLAKPDYTFLHCLPAHRGEEVSADVIDGPHSAVFDQAENRLHAQKAVLHELMK